MMKSNAIIGEILAAWEDAANTAAIDCHRNAEEDAIRLLRNGIELPIGATREVHEQAIRAAWEAIENGREMAKAWRIVANGLRRFLRVLNVPTYWQRGHRVANAPARPWQRRHEHDAAMQAGSVAPHDKRTPIALPSVDAIVSAAKAQGIEVIE
jgi:hypothetical protein